MCQFGPVKLPWGPRRGQSLKSKFLPPPFPVVCNWKNCFLTNQMAMHWNDLKVYIKVWRSVLASVPFRSKHFDAFWHFLSFRSYTPCFGYNKFDWLSLVLCFNWTCRIWFWILFLRPFCIVFSEFMYLLPFLNNSPLKRTKGVYEGFTLTCSHN